MQILHLDPVPELLARTRGELPAAFDPALPLRREPSPGRLDVMGGIADYTGSLVAEATLDRAAAVILQERSDRELQIFSFNLFDEHRPFTFRIALDALTKSSADELRREFASPGAVGRPISPVVFLFSTNTATSISVIQSFPGINLAILTPCRWARA